jgi:hypothetical protein
LGGGWWGVSVCVCGVVGLRVVDCGLCDRLVMNFGILHVWPIYGDVPEIGVGASNDCEVRLLRD